MAEGRCPVCDSPPGRQERVVTVTEVAAERVNKAAKDLETQRRNFEALRTQREAIAGRIAAMRDERRDLQQALDKYRLELAALEARMPISAAAMSELEAAVKVGQEKVDELAKNRAEAIRTFRLLVTKASMLIEDKHPP